MALNLGDLEKINQYEKNKNVTKVDGISFKKLSSTYNPSKNNKKKNYYSVLDNGYQVGDLTRIFLGEAGRGINDFKNIAVGVPKGIVDTTKNIINESDALKDGYQFGDATKTIGSTLLSTGQLIGTGAMKGVEGVVDFGADLTGGASDWVNTKLEKAVGLHKGKTEKEVNQAKAKSRRDMIATDTTGEFLKNIGKDEFYKDLVESNSIIKTDNIGGMIAQEIGRQSLNLLMANKLSGGQLPAVNNKVGNFWVNAYNKGLSSIPMLTGAYGSGIEEAYQNGATTSEARRYGALSAATETVTEWLTGGIPGLKGSAGKGLDGLASKLIGEGVEETSKSLTKALLKSGYKLVGEGTEELISEYMNPYLKQFTYEYNKEKDILGNLGEAKSKVSIQDMLTSFIIGAITAGIMDAPNMASDIKAGYKNRKKTTLPIQNNNNSLNIKDNTINLGEITNDNTNISDKHNLPINTINVSNNDISNNIADNHNSNQQQIEKYQYLPSNNKKINILNETASKYFDNSKRTRDMLNTFSKIITDKNYTIMFDDKLSNNSNNFVNGQIRTLENGETEIRINPNSERAGEFLIMHEVTHAIETESMKNLVIDYAMKNKEFPQALESLKQTYGTDDVSSEVLADVSGQLFGNQEFINNLSMKQPNIFNKIYNKIIELANKITGNSKESLFIKDLKNKWETAYRTQNNNIDNQKYHISPNLSTDIDNVLNNINERNPVRVRDYTPKVLVAYGIEDLPMYENPSHIRKNILTAKEARNMGLSVMPKDHYHGLGKDLYIKAIDSLDNPRVIFKRNNSNNYVILTAIKDNNNNNIIVPIEIETTTNVNNIKIDTNRVKTVYGYDIKNPDLNDYIKHNLNNNEFIKIYEQKKERGTGNSTVASSFYGNSITQSNDNVKLPTKYSMQNSQNNTSELSNSSFSLEQRVSGDNLIDAQDLIEEIKSVGAKVDKNGYVTVYHQTSSENAKKIRETGKMISKENDIFFSTSKNASQSDGRGQVKLEFKIPAEKLMLDDIFSDNADVKISLNGQKSLDVSRYIIDTKYSQNNDKWQEHLEKNYKATGTRTYFDDIQNNNKHLLPIDKNHNLEVQTMWKQKKKNSATASDAIVPRSQTSETDSGTSSFLDDNNTTKSTKSQIASLPSQYNMQQNELNIPTRKDNKIMDPLEISKLTKQDANTTPLLPKYNAVTGDGESSFYENVTKKSKFLDKDTRNIISNEEDVKFYKRITNEETLNKAYKKLQDGGEAETLNWFKRNGYDETGKYQYKPTAEDVAEGWILMKQYQDAGDYDSVVEIAKKMREIGTQAGQTVQAFNIMERLTPEGMVKYAQSELSEAFEKMSKNKTKEWIESNREKFDLKQDEVQFIIDTMQEVSKMKDGYNKRVQLAQIQKLMTDKLPTTSGNKIKSWMRISMLFNPKTQVRNVAGNAIIAPVNYFGDLFSSYADKIISKKTGVRTTGNMNVKAILKGLKQGAYEATNDYKLGINTKDMEGNRFEIGEGKSFSEKNLIGKSLNRVEGMLNYVMDAGDRVFSQSSFENSIQNQLILNNTTEITQEMIDIARSESLQRTWNDNNNYTRFVLNIRKGINSVPVFGKYCLGDVLIPFAKTPANLTKAIVDYSPAGMVKTIVEGNNLRKSLTNGQYTAKMQHQFVQDLGKATAGSMLYVLGYALAKAGITTGESDDDKDVANFLKNSLGISSYSIKIGGKTFTYDWAQPIAAPLSITSNLVNSKKDGVALLEGIVGSMDTAGSILLEQSFLQSLNDVLNDNDGVVSGIINELLELPARTVPTFSKQIVDLVDETQRTSYEYKNPVKTAVNNIKAKIPGLSKTLAPVTDTLGNEVKRYGGKNNIFNVFLNPANVNNENISKSGKEIYRLYKETGDKSIMPRVAPYYINSKGEKITLTSYQKSQYQKISGTIIDDNVKKLINKKEYQNMSDSDKSTIIKSIVDYSYNKARKEILDIDMPTTYNKINKYISNGGEVSNYYLNKEEIDYSLDNPDKYAVVTQITSYKKYKDYAKELETLRDNSTNKKEDTIKYISSLNLNVPQKAIFIKQYYSSFDNYDKEIINYINNKNLSLNQKQIILKKIGFTIKNGRVY